MMKIGLVLALVAFGALWYTGVRNEEAMAKCQIEHSFDTCFSSLNR